MTVVRTGLRGCGLMAALAVLAIVSIPWLIYGMGAKDTDREQSILDRSPIYRFLNWAIPSP